MQIACWQLCFSSRLTRAWSSTRLKRNIPSRRIRYAPSLVEHCGKLLEQVYYSFSVTCPSSRRFHWQHNPYFEAATGGIAGAHAASVQLY